MAYTDRYIAYFQRHYNQQLVRIRLQKQDYAGAVAELDCNGESALTLSYQGDERFTPIRTLVASVSLVSDQQFELSELYSDTERTWRCVIQREIGADIWEDLFIGWLEPWEAQEPYAQKPYIVSFSAVCGLGQLKQLPFAQYPSGKVDWEVRQVFAIISRALAWSGHSLAIYYSSNYIEKNQLDPAGGANATQLAGQFGILSLRQHTRLFQNEDGSPKTCYDVLETYMAGQFTICQEGGKWKIYQWAKAYGEGTANLQKWVVFNDNTGTNVTYLTRTPRLTINYDASGKPIAGGNLAVERSITKYKSVFNYGRDWNELINGDFSAYNETTKTFPGWQNNGFLPNEVIRDGQGTADDPYRMRIGGHVTQLSRRFVDPKFMQQIYSLPTQPGIKNEFRLRGKFKNVNTAGAKISVAVGQNGSASYYLQSDGKWTPVASIHDNGKSQYLWFDNQEEDKAINGPNTPEKNLKYRSKNSNGSFEVAIPPVPSGTTTFGQLQLIVGLYRGKTLGGYESASVQHPSPDYIDFEFVELVTYIYGNGVRTDIEEETYELDYQVNNGAFKRSADELTFKTGDLPGFKKYGRLLRQNNTPATGWYHEGAPVVEGGRHLALMNTEAMLSQTATQKRVYEGKILGEPLLFDVLHLEELGKYMQALGYKWDVMRGEVEVRAIEVAPPLLTGFTRKATMTTEDGNVIPFPAGTSPDLPAGHKLDYLKNQVKGLAGFIKGSGMAVPGKVTGGTSGVIVSGGLIFEFKSNINEILKRLKGR
ncbi:hypothetical protein [Tellurirhabdus bombi]|uniref:hypothetical protein n=1 Tax=Tellurirhabdus bombi TaxID=2907205 RepID=UPI001F2E303B|nr:hypothetical protein [Tellurirhabdus bombi]